MHSGYTKRCGSNRWKYNPIRVKRYEYYEDEKVWEVASKHFDEQIKVYEGLIDEYTKAKGSTELIVYWKKRIAFIQKLKNKYDV